MLPIEFDASAIPSLQQDDCTSHFYKGDANNLECMDEDESLHCDHYLDTEYDKLSNNNCTLCFT